MAVDVVSQVSEGELPIARHRLATSGCEGLAGGPMEVRAAGVVLAAPRHEGSF